MYPFSEFGTQPQRQDQRCYSSADHKERLELGKRLHRSIYAEDAPTQVRQIRLLNLTNMTSSTNSKMEVKSAVTSPTAPHVIEPPKYYDSEPSSQPPQYSQASSKSTTQPSNAGSGASAATIAAVLAYPPGAQLNKKKEKDTRPWRERWRDWKARHNDPDLGGGMQVSGPTLNVQGIGVKSWTMINSPRWEKRG
jgi:hypothetical protein